MLRKKCAEKKMLNFIYKNLKYPKVARDISIEGRTIMRFIIEKDGRLTNIKPLREIHPDFTKEAIRVIEFMINLK